MIKTENIIDLRPDEKIVIHIRRHWYIFFRAFLVYAFLIILPAIIYGLMRFYFQFDFAYFENEVARSFILIFIFIYYMAILLFCLTLWTDIYLDVWTITNYRIINREQNGLFNRVVSKLELSKVQDVTVEQKGMVTTFLNYGDVFIQTAGEKERFVFEQVGSPFQIAKTILRLIDENNKANKPHRVF